MLLDIDKRVSNEHFLRAAQGMRVGRILVLMAKPEQVSHTEITLCVPVREQVRCVLIVDAVVW